MVTGRAALSDITSNARLKHYPGVNVLQVANARIFREPGFEDAVPRPYSVPSKGHAANAERSLESSRRRAAAAVRDIALCNGFTHFVTLTLDPARIDRYDAEEVSRKLRTFLKNASARKGLAYVVVPERHADGAIHLHGLCKLGSVRTVRATDAHGGHSLSTNRGQPIYNLPEWVYGFSTCIPIDGDYEKTCNYVVKYLTKAGEKIFGKWYFCSRSLQKKPSVLLVDDIDYQSFRTDHPSLAEIPLFKDVCLCSLRLPLERGGESA